MTKLPDLENATLGEELNPLAYDVDDYPPIEDMLARVNASDDRIEINCEELSVNGTVVQDDMNVYLGTKAVSNSALKEALKSPLHYHFYMNDRTEKKDKSHFELGTFAHMAFLEPERFDLCVEEPDASLSSKDGVNTLIEFWKGLSNIVQLNDAKTWVKQEGYDMDKIDGLKAYYRKLKALNKHMAVSESDAIIIKWLKRHYDTYGGGILRKIFKGAKAEVSMYGTDPETGLKVKIRPDAINIEENIGVNAIISVKTTRASTKGKFEMDCASYGYHIGEGMYQKVASQITGRNFNVTIMVMLQTEAPYLPAVYWWSPEDLHLGKLKYDLGMITIAEAMERGIYPGFDAYAESGHQGIIQMHLPSWIQRDLDPVDLED